MKKSIKKLLQVGALIGVFAGGYYVNDISKNIESNVQAETIKKETIDELKAEQGFNISSIPNDKDNIFTQYFTVSEIKDNVVYVTNTYFKDDFVILEKNDLASLKYEVGTKIAITYNHDDIQNIEYDNHKTYIYNIVDSKESGIETDNEKYVFGINPLDSADFTTIDKKDYVIGDIVKVTYKEGSNTEVETTSKIGRWKEAEQEIQKNEVQTASQNLEKNVEKLVQQNTEIVKEKETPKETPKKEQPKTQNDEKVNKKEETPKTEQKQVKKEESTEKQKPAKTEQKQENNNDNSFLENDPKRANSTKEYTITEDSQEKLIHAENGNEKYLLENDNYKKGDKVKVTFGNSGYHDDIVKQEKVMSDEDKAYKDSFEENAKTDPNRNNPNYVQTEDGSFVPKNFWD